MTTPIDGKTLTAVVNQLELECLDGFKPQATVAEPTRHALPMRSSFAFSIYCVTDSGYYTGQSTTDSHTAADCQGKINRFVRNIEAGLDRDVTGALQRDVHNRTLYLCYNPQTYASVRHSYCEACNSCSGDGSTRCHHCSNGYQTCSQCRSGYTSCYSCSGSGYRWENNRQVSCSSCSGGQIRCYSCSGSGRTTCSYCSGRGQLDCTPCNATGYFTHWMSAAARSRAEQSCQWHENQAPAWVNDYIRKALSGSAHISLNRAVPWRFAEATYQLQDTPFTVQAEGTLVALDANVSVDDRSEKGLFLAPDSVEVWSLHHVLDQAADNISQYVLRNPTAEVLKKYLHTRIAQYALESVNKPSALPAPIAAPQLLSNEGFQQIKTTIINSAKKYDKVRNLISVKRWLMESVLCTAVLLALVAAVNFVFPQANSAGLGLATFFTGLPHTLGSLNQSLLDGSGMDLPWLAGLIMMRLPLLAGLMAIAVLLMTLLGSGRAWSRLRLSYWFVISTLLAMGLVSQLQMAFEQPVAARWWTLQLLPDVALCGVLAGLLRARRSVFKNIGREVNSIGSAAFARMLNYKE